MTPDKFQLISKRNWEGQVKAWRRRLHEFEPKVPLEVECLAEMAVTWKAEDLNLFGYAGGLEAYEARMTFEMKKRMDLVTEAPNTVILSPGSSSDPNLEQSVSLSTAEDVAAIQPSSETVDIPEMLPSSLISELNILSHTDLLDAESQQVAMMEAEINELSLGLQSVLMEANDSLPPTTI